MFIPEPLTFDLHYTCHSEHCFFAPLPPLLHFQFLFPHPSSPQPSPSPPLPFLSHQFISVKVQFFSFLLINSPLFVSFTLPPPPLTLSFLPSVINLSLSEELKPKEFGQSFTFSHRVINLPLRLPSPPSSVPSSLPPSSPPHVQGYLCVCLAWM